MSDPRGKLGAAANDVLRQFPGAVASAVFVVGLDKSAQGCQVSMRMPDPVPLELVATVNRLLAASFREIADQLEQPPQPPDTIEDP